MQQKEMPIYLSVLRGVLIFTCFLSLSSLISFILKAAAATGHELVYNLPNFLVYAIITVGSVLIFNSFALAFANSDKCEIEKFEERESKKVSLFSEIKYAICSKRLLAEMITAISLVAIFSACGAFSFVGGCFGLYGNESKAFTALTLTPVCACLMLLSKYEAARHFRKLSESRSLDKLLEPSWFITRMLMIIFLYPLAMPISPLLAYYVFSLVSIIVEITVLLSIFGTILAFAALVFLLWGISVLRGVSKRKKFLKKLHASAEQNGFSVYDVKNPYRSFATSRDFCTFFLEQHGKVYSCLMISTVSKRVPLVFTSPQDAHFLRRLGTKDHGFSMRHNIDFYIYEGGTKIVIVDPVPKKVLVSEGGSQKRLYCSDKIWDFTVHDSSSFLGAAERACLDKSSKGED